MRSGKGLHQKEGSLHVSLSFFLSRGRKGSSVGRDFFLTAENVNMGVHIFFVLVFGGGVSILSFVRAALGGGARGRRPWVVLPSRHTAVVVVSGTLLLLFFGTVFPFAVMRPAPPTLGDVRASDTRTRKSEDETSVPETILNRVFDEIKRPTTSTDTLQCRRSPAPPRLLFAWSSTRRATAVVT